ncbi:MAG TPA: hypothetical protein VLT45_06050 [Kofleriaceae bacterium]|nr:hypothetical protein [Kofleriaceae bacterium]
MRIALALCLVVVVGCKKDNKASTGSAAGSAAPAAAAGDCATVINGALDRTALAAFGSGGGAGSAEVAAIQKDMLATLAPIKAGLTRACTDDHWPPEALACLAAAHDEASVDACEGKLSPEQSAHAKTAIEQAQKAAQPAASPICEKYAKFEIECGGAGEDARPTILDFCAKARAGAKEATYQLIALESTCADESADCAAYKACVDKKKAETSPQ